MHEEMFSAKRYRLLQRRKVLALGLLQCVAALQDMRHTQKNMLIPVPCHRLKADGEPIRIVSRRHRYGGDSHKIAEENIAFKRLRMLSRSDKRANRMISVVRRTSLSPAGKASWLYKGAVIGVVGVTMISTFSNMPLILSKAKRLTLNPCEMMI